MKLIKRHDKKSYKPEVVSVPQTSSNFSTYYYSNSNAINVGQMRMYEALREQIPIIDAAICKTAKLVGGCEVVCTTENATERLKEFLSNVQVNSCGYSLETFLSIYIEQLLTFGTSIGEMVTDNSNNIVALYNASLEDIELRAENNPLDVDIYVKDGLNGYKLIDNKNFILLSTISPKPGHITGESILTSLPFVSEILSKIYKTIGINWDRVGNVRFAVTYQPSNDSVSKAYTKERASILADEWRKAMSNTGDNSVSDFVAVGDVNVKVIGADNQILDSDIPVKQMLEQIVSKLGIPPFLLGLNWSSTERMAEQQADMFTSELESYRRILNPIISKICSMWLRLNGFNDTFEIKWQNINFQDTVDTANARLIQAKADEIMYNMEEKKS